MRGAGFEPLSDSRPGHWCTGRDENGNPVNEIDLLAPDALVCAKAYKLYARIDERESAKGKDRVSPKDASDLWRLVATSAGEDVRRVFDEYENHEVIGESVHKGRGM